jgi:ABC-2 type transport system ATP-binding protein
VSIVVTNQLSKHYGRRVGVEGLDLSIPSGSLFGFLGPNGAGKTTTIRVLLGLLRPSWGTASVFGLDCWRHSRRIKKELGYLPGDLRLYPWLTLRSAARIIGQVRRRDLRDAAYELASDFDFDPDLRAREMSRGTRQKLGLVLALVHRPRLLILDEPTASLDPIMQEKLYLRLQNMVAAGHTVLFSSHTLGEVERLCDRVAILREGRLVADETVENLRARASREVVITWRCETSGTAIDVPGFLTLRGRDERQWRATMTGPVIELVRWGAGQPIEDLSIGQPDLGDLFLEYYRNSEGCA